MNRKGFTLIELLSVIIILALLTLFVGTGVTRLVKKSKEDIYNTQLASIESAAMAWGIDNPNMLPSIGECKYIKIGLLKEYGLLDKNIMDSKTNSKISENMIIKIIGSSSKYGNLDIKYEVGATDIDGCSMANVPICKRATLLHTETCSQTSTSSYCSGTGYTASGSKQTTTITYGSLGTNGTLNSGDAFDCDVDGDGNYGECDETTGKCTERFYYVSDYYNGDTNTFDDSIATLIYYNNYYNKGPNNTSSSRKAYNSANVNNLGPVTAVVNLPTTDSWNNIKLKKELRQITNENGELTTNNGALSINKFDYTGYAARLLTYQEVVYACGAGTPSTTSYLDNCIYLMENTKYSSSSMGTYGYWLETSNSSNTNSFDIYTNTKIITSNSPNYTNNYGVRPVIEVPKYKIIY